MTTETTKLNERSIGALIVTQSNKLWKASIAFSVMFHMVGQDKPAKAIATFASDDASKRDHKTFIDALRGVWPSAGIFYANLPLEAKRAMLDMPAAAVRDNVLKLIDAHIKALGLDAGAGRTAYLERIKYADQAAYDASVALKNEFAAKEDAATGDTVDATAGGLTTPEDEAKALADAHAKEQARQATIVPDTCAMLASLTAAQRADILASLLAMVEADNAPAVPTAAQQDAAAPTANRKPRVVKALSELSTAA